MFSGIVQAVGSLRQRWQGEDGQRLLLSPGGLDLAKVANGDSIAVNGVCLTVAELGEEGFMVDLGPQTCSLTTLAELPLGGELNLERALTLSDALGGHMVSGHVDAVAKLQARRQQQDSAALDFSFPAELAAYICPRCSVCIDGVSLTVAAVDGNSMTVQCIPHTLGHTNLGKIQPEARVNIEVDMVARYVRRIMSFMADNK